MLVAAAVSTIALSFALRLSSASASTGFTPGDVVVYRVGTGSGALSGSAFPVFLDEYEASGKLVESVALPTSTSGTNKPLLASGSASSEGLLTLSGNDEYLVLSGYDTSAGTAKVSETADTSVPRTIGRVSANHEINTSTALTDAGNANNPRGATSNDGTQFWWSGAGKSTSGGVHYATLGASTSTLMSTSDTNARAVAIFDGQLYTSSDPTKESIDIATVGSGLPTTSGQSTTNLPFSSEPAEPYAFTLLTLGLGSTPDTMYVAENSSGAIVKYGLSGGKWVKDGSVAVANVTGVTADDIDGVVEVFATTSGSSGEGGALYKITDASGVNGTLSGTATLIASAPSDEAFRGVAFTPGTTFGSGGTPPPPAPTITAAEGNLPAAIDDPTNPTLGVEVSDSEYAASELTVTAGSSNTAVAASVNVTGSGAERTLTVTPGTSVGYSTITLTVEAPNGAKAETTVNYGLSAYQGNATDRYYDGAGNGSTAIDVGGGYMIVGDDENNVLRLYHERTSGQPVKTFDFTSKLPDGATEIDIESSARAGKILYWMGSMSNTKTSGKLEPGRNVLFAAEIKGSGASTELTYLGSDTHLREEMVEWDEKNGNPLGLKQSTEAGHPSAEASGFNAEGLEFAAGSTSTAYVAFRAPLEPPNNRDDALMVPVTNFSSLIGGSKATFGTPIEWNLDGLGIREIRKNAAGEYLVIAGTSDGSNSSFGLYTWDGNPSDQPVLSETHLEAVAEGAWESIVSVPEPIASGDEIELLEDNGDTAWYGDGLDSKDGLPAGLTKDLGRMFTIELPKAPAPSQPGTPSLSSGATPSDSGQLALSWRASSGKNVTYTLEQQNAEGGWSTVASGLTATEYGFGAGNPESEGTWTYRVIAGDEGGESEPSGESDAVKVDETAPNAPSATPDRAPDYAGDGGWYKDSVTVSFTANGDPALSDGSVGSGVDPSTLSAPQTFTTDGAHVASGTVSDYAGNTSAPGTLTVQVDATPPSVEIACPATATIGQKNVVATVTASDGQSGLATDPSGTVSIDTGEPGPVTITRTAEDNVGHVTEASCTTDVVYAEVVSGTVSKLTVKAGQNVELEPSAKVTGAVKVKAGGSLFVDGATIDGNLAVNGATSLRICGASLDKATVSTVTGPVVIGESDGSCAPSSFAGNLTVKNSTDGVTIEGETLTDGNAIGGALKVLDNSGGTTVTDNQVTGALTVKGNAAPVVDKPNVVYGKSKVQ